MADTIRFYLDDQQVAAMVTENTDLRVQLKEIRMNRGYTLKEIRHALGIGDTPTDQELFEEDFTQKNRINDWRNYAHEPRWTTMTDLERLVDYAQATTAANYGEEWD
jgi:hypothetical protein